MSYILEALKKAQAERQLGNAPTIHAPAASADPVARVNRKPLAIGVAAGVVLVAAMLLMWRRQDAPVPVPTPPVAAAPAPAPVAAAPAPAPAPPPVVAPPAQVALVGKPDAAPKPVEREAVAVAKPVAPAPAPAHAASAPAPAVAAPAHVANAPAPAVAAPPVPAPASADESLPAFGALPDAIRRDIPKVAFGGYMYSPNPSDRLILIDNVLRHEGEEVAPGLVLEKLLPKGAVMNYRGNRYRVPF